MSEASQTFRDYTTRISFNLSLSRNQVGHLAAAVMEIENEHLGETKMDIQRNKREKEVIMAAGGRPNLFVVGYGSLCRMGLLVHDPRWKAVYGTKEFWKYNGPAYQLTEAGKHVVELLRIAGLMPQVAANTQKRKRKAA